MGCVIQYIDDKRESENLVDTAVSLKRAEDENGRREDQNRRLEIGKQDTCLLVLSTWWTIMEDEAST